MCGPEGVTPTPAENPDQGTGRREFLARSLAIGAAGALAADFMPMRPAAASTRRRVAVPQPAITARAEWGSTLRPTGAIPPEEVKFLIVHHTLEPGSDYAVGDVARLLGGIYDYHTRSKGWPDVAYNLFVDRFGGIWEGRTGSIAGPVRGDATGGNQGYTQLCCFIGDHRVDAPTPEAQSSMVSLLAWLADRYHVDTTPGATVRFVSRGSNRWAAGTSVTASTIAAHRDMSSTECPGDACYQLVIGEFPPRAHALAAVGVETSAAPTTAAPTTAAPTTAAPTTAAPTTAAPTTIPGSTAADNATAAEAAPAGSAAEADNSRWLLVGGAGAVTAAVAGAGLEARRRRDRDGGASP